MKTNLFLRLITVGWIFLAACSSVRFHYESDRKTDFTRYKTFAFANDLPRKAFGSNIAARELREEMQNALAARGLVYSEDSPDLLVSFSTDTETEERAHTNYFPAWGMWGWGGFGFPGWGWGRGGWWGTPWDFWPGWGWGGPLYSDSRVEKVKVGTLTVEFTDAVEDKVIWRSTAKGSVNTPDEMYNMLRSSLKRLFTKFPLRQVRT